MTSNIAVVPLHGLPKVSSIVSSGPPSDSPKGTFTDSGDFLVVGSGFRFLLVWFPVLTYSEATGSESVERRGEATGVTRSTGSNSTQQEAPGGTPENTFEEAGMGSS